MERLTEKHYGGKGYYMKCSGVLRCNGTCGDCEELARAVDRLGQFEDKAEQQPKTNAERIRAMSDEELANVIALLIEKDECFREDFADCKKCPLHSFCSACKPGFELDWLKQPAEGD